MIISPPRRALPLATAAVAAAVGAIVASRYAALGLTLSHYDARGHLVVARRIFDSITPGWQQIGAVWLPLPHVLNAIPVQIDALYRSGGSAVAISIISYAVACGAIAWIVRSITGSTPLAIAAAAVFGLNPNVLYLQSTPMTEPLLLATTTIAVAMVIADVRRRDASSDWLRATGVAFALACLTRYEAWPVTASVLTAAAWVRWRSGEALPVAIRRVAAIAAYPALAIAGFVVLSRVVVGEWFVSSGFFVPENKALGDWWLAAKEIGWGLAMLSGPAITWVAGIGVVAAVLAAVPVAVLRRRLGLPPDAIIAVSLLAMAAIPWVAFVRGHPYRIRYMVPLVAVEAVGAAFTASIVRSRRATVIGAAALVVLAALELRPLDAKAPMVVEAQWDRPNTPERARVTECIGRPGHGAKIMASMGSLGHYMQEASRQGFAIRDFLHEGNGDIWLAALDDPKPFAAWVLIEEKAEGGDMLAKIARDRPAFLAGYARVCEGAGLALYRRLDAASSSDEIDSAEGAGDANRIRGNGPAGSISDARRR